MKFLDHIRLSISSGKGGDGLISFKQEPFQPRQGPDGGDGGEGGSVFIVGKLGLSTLSNLRYNHVYKAEDGHSGGTNAKTGRSGEDLSLSVPLGTIVRQEETGTVLAEILEPERPYLVAKGGKAGIGNIHFARSTRQIPEIATNGGAAEEFFVEMELKLMADVGLAGLPNAGKSTLLSKLSAAKPKIADYPFTTLTPQLGVVTRPVSAFVEQSFVMADIPGLIEGAKDGKGLGHEFLRHIERTRAIAFILDGKSPDTFNAEGEMSPEAQYEMLEDEIYSFSPEMKSKKTIALLTKKDLWPDETERAERFETINSYFSQRGIKCVWISAWQSDDHDLIKKTLFEMVLDAKKADDKNETLPSLAIEEEFDEAFLRSLAEYKILRSAQTNKPPRP